MAYSLARGERENIGVSHRDTSPPRLGATRQKDIGTTHMDNSKDYGFGWLGENNYDWEASRRETDPMSRRDNLDDWNAYGATLRDDEGEARRDHLGRKKKENLGAMRRVDLGTTGNTRREDFGVSARDGLGATAAYSHRDSRYGSSVTTHSERFHREAAGNRRGELGASRPDYMLNTLTEEQSKATLPEYDYTYTRERPQEPRKWTSVAADRNLMNDWHSMFGQIRTKWAPGTDDPMSISKLSEGRYGYSNSSESQEDRRQRIQRHGLIAVALAVVALVAVIILTVILLGIKSEDNSEVLFKYEYQATLEDEYYVAEMENTSSEAFSNVSNRFCGQLDENAGLQANGTVDNYEGCVVTEISSGSLILTFHIVIRNSRSRQPSPQQVIIFVGLVLDGEETINGFKVTTVIVITQQIEITEDENPVPKKVAFNATCSANQRCITTQAECRGDICTCPVDRYYEETPDKCTPIQCGDVPTVEHGEVTTTGSSYGSTLAVNCNSGYDISDNGSVSCATHGSWGTIPVCNPIECVEFIIPDNAKEVANKTGRMFNESIVISCNDGFEIQESSAVVTCQSDKSWSSSPQCSLVTCSTYNIPNNAVVTSSNSNTTLLNDTITMRCEHGYEIDGEEAVTCQANNTWSISPSCNPLVCSYSAPEHGSLSNNATTEGKYNETITVSVECSSGYELEGTTTITCQASANFTAGPTCKPITCQDFAIPDHATVDSDVIGRIFNDVINITCNDGYTLDGVDTVSKVICEADTTWSESAACIPVVCVEIDIPEHATIVTSVQQEYVYNETITVECDEGYELDGEGSISCQADTTWTAIPVCKPILCEEFVTPANAESETNDHSFNDTVNIKCNEGFKLDGDSSVTCQANSSWSPAPSCNIVNCSMFDLPDNAVIVSGDETSRAFNDTMTMNCNEGYKIVGPETVTCQATETWTESPSCSPLVCYYSPPEHGSLSNNATTEGKYNETITVSVECSSGYELEGTTTITCQASANFTAGPTCKPITCQEFAIPDHATVDSDVIGRIFNDVINITCNDGYTLDGVDTVSKVICEADTTWSESAACISVVCVEIDIPEHATIVTSVQQEYVYNETITVECDDGYELDGEGSISCQADTTWTAIPVCIQIECKTFQIPDRAEVPDNINDTVAGTKIMLSCVDGYNLVGNESVICLSNGTWTSTPSCEPKDCGKPDEIANSNVVVVNETTFNNSFVVVCQVGYTLQNKSTVTCQSNGIWSQFPICELVSCGNASTPDNADVTINDGNNYGSNVSFACVEGFTLIGKSFITCQQNKSWTESPICEIEDCGDLDEFGNGTVVNQTGTTFGSITYVQCNEEFSMIGNENISCLATGEWETLPLCQKIDCGQFLPPDHASVEANFTINCEQGYEIDGVSILECLNTGTWSEVGTCNAVQCDSFPTSVANGNVTSVTGTEYTDVVTIECSTGFILIGSSEIMCQANGTWEPSPICDEIQCGNVYINNGSISNSSVLTVVCDAGFVLNGTDNIICKDGNWTAVPTCEPIPCPKYVAPSNGNVSYSGNIVGSRVSITCTNGYEVNGNDTALCMEDGNWSGNISCDPIDCGPYVVPSPYTHYVDGNIATTYNSSVPVACISGLEHTNASATMVTCEAVGMWSGEPDCAILGSVVFTDTNYNFVEGDVKMITCEVTNYPTWQSVVLAKVDMPNNTQNDASNMISMLLFRISNINGSLENTTFNDNYAIDTTIREDGVSLDIRFDPFKCDDEGEYICSVLVGDMDNPVDAKYSNTTATISTYSLVPEIILPEKIYLGKEASVECIGDIGKGEDGEPTGQLIVEANFGDNGSFVSFNASESPVEKMCHFTNTISLPIPTDNPAEGVVVRCVILQLNGSRLVSDERTFDILSSYVTFENSSYIFNIGENASLTCDVENIPDWTSIEIRRPSGDVSLRVNSSDTSEHYSDAHITLNAASVVTNDSAKLVVDFKPVHCTDADGEVGTVEYTCKVLTANSTTESTTSITFQKPPMEPKLTMSRQIVEAQPTWSGRTFHCEGEVGNPEGHIEVESNFDGEFSRLLANVPGENKTSYGFILSSSFTVTPSDDCGYHHAFEFALENITMDYMHLRNLRCVTKPAAELDNGMTLYSEEKVMKVIPVTYCEGSTDTFKPHLYYCNYAIQCKTDGTVLGVPEPCDIDMCFDTSGGIDNGCKSCDSIGGCSIQEIQCDKTSIASYKGDIVEFTCNTQDIGEVTHISISSPNATPIDTQGDSIQVADGVNVTISQQNVMLRFTNVSCDQEGVYVIRVNNQTEVTLTLSVISDPGQPDIFIPTIMAVNKEMQVNCSGLIGRDDDGKNKATIILEVKFEGTAEYLIYNHGDGMRTEAEADCDISEAVVYDITPDLSWNNSDIRCVTQNDSQDVYSDRESIILQVPDIYCEPVLISTDTGALAIFTCGLKDISNIESIVVSRNETELINEGTTSLPYEYNQDFTLTIPSLDEFVVNFTSVKCADEGEYVITINDISSASLTLRIVSDPDIPSLNMPSRGTVNELYEMSCSGPVGRDMYGDAATALYLEVKFADESEFSIYTNVTRESVSYNNCQYTEIIRLELYPDASWNASTVRCVTRNDTDMVTATGDRQVMLHSANTYFEKADTLAFVGESYLFACIVEHKPGLSDIVISKGINKTVIAAFASNTAIDGVEILADESSVVNETGVLKINMTVQCGDGVEYYCSPVGTGAASEDVISLVVQWKALTPVLDPSSDMVEGNSAWSGLGSETRCSAELGYANASVYFESNINGEFQRIEETLLFGPEFNPDACSNTVTIKFDNSYTAAWNGTIIRCVVETADELLMDAEYATVIPETYCEGYSTGTQLPHPFDCRAWLTCNARITPYRPNKNCAVDECYDVLVNSKCVPCADYSKCRPDPMDALPPGTPYMTCSESTGWMGNEASIDCYLSNSTIVDLPNAMVTVLNASGQIFDSTTESPTSSTASEATFSIQGGLSVIIRPTHIEIRFSPVQCYQEGNYTVQYNGSSGLKDTGMLTVQSAQAVPVISKEPAHFYSGLEMIVTCKGNTGKPEGELVLKYRTSFAEPYAAVTVEPGSNEFDEQECTYKKTLTYSFFVDSNMEGFGYVCETMSHNGSTSTSETETVTIESPAVYFVSYDEKARLGESITIQCVLANNEGQAGALLSRSSNESHPATELCTANSTGDVTCLDGYSGMVNVEGTNRTLSVTIASVSCSDEGTYYCEPLGNGGLRSRMDLKVTRPLSTPVLNLPKDNAAIAGVLINIGDPVICIVDAGYPADGKQLKVQFRKNGTAAFEDFVIKNAQESCAVNETTISISGNTFGTDMDEAEFRCGLFANGSDSPIETSNNETLHVMENNCPANSETYTYQYYPYNCHKYIWCYPSGIAISTCAGGGCPNITETEPNCLASHCSICTLS